MGYAGNGKCSQLLPGTGGFVLFSPNATVFVSEALPQGRESHFLAFEILNTCVLV